MEDDQPWTTERIDALPAWTLVRAYHLLARELYSLFAEQQLSPVQFGVLAQLSATPELTSSQLARAVMIRPQSMGEVVTGLVERKLLVRSGSGGRGRPAPLALTDAGRQVVNRAGAALETFNTPEHLGLTGRDVVQLNISLHAIVRRFS